MKKTPNKEYYFIDGGMTDNIRPALYQAKYDCDIVGKENEEKTEVVTIAGKCCESGD
jgi:diaminopimelate decarboxylase